MTHSTHALCTTCSTYLYQAGSTFACGNGHVQPPQQKERERISPYRDRPLPPPRADTRTQAGKKRRA